MTCFAKEAFRSWPACLPFWLPLDATSRFPRLDMASAGVRNGAPVQHSLLLLFFQRPPGVSGASGFGNRAFFLRQPGVEAALLCAPGAPSG